MVVVSVTVGSVWLHDFDTQRNELQAEISELNAIADRQQRHHIQADETAETADTMVAFALYAVRDGKRPDPFLVNRAGVYLKRAITTMWVSTVGAERDEALFSTVEDLRAKLNGGDLAAYDEMSKIFNEQAIRSNRAVSEFREEIAEYEAQVMGLWLRVDRVRDSQAGLNIIGLVIVLLKDLPIWGRRREVQ